MSLVMRIGCSIHYYFSAFQSRQNYEDVTLNKPSRYRCVCNHRRRRCISIRSADPLLVANVPDSALWDNLKIIWACWLFRIAPLSIDLSVSRVLVIYIATSFRIRRISILSATVLWVELIVAGRVMAFRRWLQKTSCSSTHSTLEPRNQVVAMWQPICRILSQVFVIPLCILLDRPSPLGLSCTVISYVFRTRISLVRPLPFRILDVSGYSYRCTRCVCSKNKSPD